MDFERTYPKGECDWSQEWIEYSNHCISDIDLVCSTIAQSCEIAMKAKVAEISPYLLLAGGDFNFSKSKDVVDFSDFRTISAVDLPSALKVICDNPLSDKFITMYGELRKIRNSVVHIGDQPNEISISKIVEYLVLQYCTLWDGKLWLKYYLEYSSKSRKSNLFDGSNWNEYADVKSFWSELISVLTKGQFKRLIGKPKNQKRYFCPRCMYYAGSDYFEPDLKEHATAYYNGKDNLDCIMCGSCFPVVSAGKKCKNCEKRSYHIKYESFTCCANCSREVK